MSQFHHRIIVRIMSHFLQYHLMKLFRSLHSLYCIIPQDFQSDFIRAIKFQYFMTHAIFSIIWVALLQMSQLSDSERLKFVTIFRPLWLSEKGWIYSSLAHSIAASTRSRIALVLHYGGWKKSIASVQLRWAREKYWSAWVQEQTWKLLILAFSFNSIIPHFESRLRTIIIPYIATQTPFSQWAKTSQFSDNPNFFFNLNLKSVKDLKLK